MTFEQKKKEIELFVLDLFNELTPYEKHVYMTQSPVLPMDTGDLKNKAWSIEFTGDEITITIDDKDLPYVRWIDENPRYQTYKYRDKVMMYIINEITNRFQ